jgi:preprotein translocase subunit SecF
MEFFRIKTNIDFIGKKNYALAFSSILILITIISLIIHKGPRYGVDFAGGISVRVKFSQPVTAAEINMNSRFNQAKKTLILKIFRRHSVKRYQKNLEKDALRFEKLRP